MIVSTLSLSHFRNYEQVLIEPDAGVTVFTGPNAQGKTCMSGVWGAVIEPHAMCK